MTKVMCFGTFDLLHLGHLNYFKQAKESGNYLIVVIARDETKRKQNKKLVFSEKERLKLVKSLEIVDKAILGDLQDQLLIIEKEKPDILCLGYDQKIDEEKLRKELEERGLSPKILRAKPYQENKYKSSKIKRNYRSGRQH